MKKFLSLLICFVMVFSGTVIAAPAENAESAEKLLTDFFNNNKDTLFPETDVEIEEAFLADIDNDTEPELLATLGAYFYGMTVYKVKDKKVVKMPDVIMFGRGTGINENYSFLMADDGHMYIYRDSFNAHVPWEQSVTTQVIYDWSENALTPINYLRVTELYEDINNEASYTTDFNAETDPEAEQIKTASAETESMINEFKSRVAPYIVWTRDNSGKSSGLNRIWDIQKARYAANTKSEADTAVTLQIGNPSMNVNGKSRAIDEDGAFPVIKNGRTLIPTDVIEKMGGTVLWDESSNTVTLSCSGNTIKLVTGSNTAYLNDVSEALDVAPEIIGGRTMLPIRFIAEGFGFDVKWETITEQIFITK